MEQLSEQFEKTRFLDCLTGADKAAVIRAFRARWSEMDEEIYAIGYLVDPEFVEGGLAVEKIPNVMAAWHRYLKRAYEDVQERAKLTEQLHSFRNSMGHIGSAEAAAAKKDTSAHTWWQLHGWELPELQKLARRVLAQPVCASACERNWSTYVWLIGKKRQRLDQDRLNKLMAIHHHGASERRKKAPLKWTEDVLIPTRTPQEMTEEEQDALDLLFDYTRLVTDMSLAE
eukprot:GHVU01056277.1.p2 GENE.GHVU01056277.1~~GHVU01056277.1.p2  ORF type:complete len:229 (-),score=47.89 GHVU01056277.1:651-1337(-)